MTGGARRGPEGIGLRHLLRPAVYGGNDGIVTTFAIVAGFAGAGAEGAGTVGAVAVLLFGFANLFADGTAMGLGDFLASRAEIDAYKTTRRHEIAALSRDPAHARAQLADALAARGLEPEEAKRVAEVLARHPEVHADMALQYVHGLPDPRDAPPGLSGAVTFCAFVAFGTIPILPYALAEPGPGTLRASVAATFAALSALGLLRWYATDQRLVRAIGETVLVGGLCAAVAFGVGLMFR